jgi:ketosteroid isomerase-like protein
MSAHEHAQLARTIYEAFNTNDFDRALSLSTADVGVVTMAFGLTQHGHEGFRQFMQGWKGMAPDRQMQQLGISQPPG